MVAPAAAARARAVQSLRVAINSDDRAGIADETRRQNGHVAHPATDIQHSHTRPQTRAPEKISCRFVEKCGLLLEPLSLLGRISEGVGAAIFPAHDASRLRWRNG